MTGARAAAVLACAHRACSTLEAGNLASAVLEVAARAVLANPVVSEAPRVALRAVALPAERLHGARRTRFAGALVRLRGVRVRCARLAGAVCGTADVDVYGLAWEAVARA